LALPEEAREREEIRFYADTMEGELPPEVVEELRKLLEEGLDAGVGEGGH